MNTSILVMTLFLIYTLIIIYLGKSGFFNICDKKDFFVANYSLGLFLCVSTFVATWFSAASFLGLSSSLYIYGVSAIVYSIIPWFIGALFLVFLVPSLKEYKILTFPELFYVKYKSKLLRISMAVLIIIAYTLYITMQIKGFGIVMELLLDIPYSISILLVYLYILYTTFGGLYSVAKTDIVNTAIIFLSSIIFGVIIILHSQGIENILQKALNIDSVAISDWSIKTPKGGLLNAFCNGLHTPLYLATSFFGWGLGLACNPQYVMRIISAKNKSVARKMILFSLLILCIIYFFISIGSIGLRTLIPTAPYVKDADEIIPLLFPKVVKNYSTGILMLGVIAASVSTANSELLLIANSFTYDILNIFKEGDNMGGEHLLFLNRIVILIAGTISLILSLNPPNTLIQFGGNIWGIFTVTSFIPLFAGTFFKNISKQSVEFSFFVGLTSYIIFSVVSNYTANIILSNIHPAFFAFASSAISFVSIEWRYEHAKH